MKILQMFPFFSSSYYGGVFAVGYALSKALTVRGHDVVVYTTDFKFSHQLADSTEIKVCPFPIQLKLAGFLITPAIRGEMRRNLKEFNIIHSHNFRGFQEILLYYYAQRYNIPYLIDAHGSIPRTGKKFLKWLFDIFFGYRILRNAARVIAETEVGAKEYEEIGISRDKVVLLHPPSPIVEFSQLPPIGCFRSKYNIKGKHIIMFLGRVHWIKGIDFLIESFCELTQLRNDVILAVVGFDDGHKSALEDLVNRLNLSSRVLFTGFLEGEEKLAALVDADIVVQTSRYEQAAGAPFEAVLCGTPIVVSKHTGAGEDVKRLDAGYLVEFGNKKELAEIINRILEEPSEARDKAKRAAKYIRENLSMSKRVEDYEKLYIECIGESKYKKGSRK